MKANTSLSEVSLWTNYDVKGSCVFWRLTSATVNFCNIAIQLITYLRLDGRIATAI